jgi:hypothetical protein
MNQHQLQIIEYLREENRVLREQLGERRVRFNDDQRRRLASKAKGLSRKLLREAATLVTPETLLAWHRKLIAHKYDGTARREPGRPKTADEIETFWTSMNCLASAGIKKIKIGASRVVCKLHSGKRPLRAHGRFRVDKWLRCDHGKQ